MNNKTKQCRLCNGNNLSEVINLGNTPIAHHMLQTVDEEEYVHPLVLHYCHTCKLIQICDPITPEQLYKSYNYCFSSWKPQPHAKDEAATIMAHSEGRSILEIGCNDGSFLKTLTGTGASKVVGIEPNPFSGKQARQKGYPIYIDFLSETLSHEIVQQHGQFSVVVARQVLEHLHDLKTFFQCLDILLSKDGFLFIDVPDIEIALEKGDCSFVWEEHVNYFTLPILRVILQRFGFSLETVKKYNFSGGSTAILSKYTTQQLNTTIPEIWEPALSDFNRKVHQYENLLKQTLDRGRREDQTIILYGVGCRACTVVNGLKLGSYIDFAIDDQPERQDKFMPGSKLKVLPPQHLTALPGPFICLLAVNQENEAAVIERIKSNQNLKKQIVFASLFSPNDIFAELERLNENA